MTGTAQQLAEKIVALLFPNDIIPPSQIPYVALAIVKRSPSLHAATEAESQFIFNELVAALASCQLARVVARSARYRA